MEWRDSMHMHYVRVSRDLSVLSSNEYYEQAGKDSIGSFDIDNSLHLTASAGGGSLMKALRPLRRNTAAIKWTFNAPRNCEGHSPFQFLPVDQSVRDREELS